jgi:hypothetical protein
MKLHKTILTFSGILLTSLTFGQSDSCRRFIGKTEYLLTEYNIGWDKTMADTLKILGGHFKKCFCDNTNKTFIKGLRHNSEAFVSIEPKIVNLKTCDGLYSYRTLIKGQHLTPHFLNGIMHFVFLVSDNKVYYLNDMYSKDSLSVNKLIEEKRPHLITSFNDKDIEIMKYLGNQNVYWTDNSTEVPLVIYIDKSILHFDNRRKE